MINKYHFGKRIAEHRKKLNLSQAELAEKLGVTSQAVSKCECAITLPDLDLLLELSHLYGVTINDLLEDNDIIATLASCDYEPGEIAYFVPKEEKAENKDWVNEIVNDHWITQNWDSSLRANNVMDEVGKNIVNHGGIIMEIGAGPGGGFMPYVLKSDPNSTMIVSDLSPTVVLEWKRHLSDKLKFPNINCAAFNFCNIPFCDNSIDVISDGGGIGNTEDGEKGKALK